VTGHVLPSTIFTFSHTAIYQCTQSLDQGLRTLLNKIEDLSEISDVITIESVSFTCKTTTTLHVGEDLLKQTTLLVEDCTKFSMKT